MKEFFYSFNRIQIYITWNFSVYIDISEIQKVLEFNNKQI